jgi:hypothetical protein
MIRVVVDRKMRREFVTFFEDEKHYLVNNYRRNKNPNRVEKLKEMMIDDRVLGRVNGQASENICRVFYGVHWMNNHFYRSIDARTGCVNVVD